MRLVTRLYLSLGMVLAIGIGLAALAGWSARGAEFLLERTNLAHRSYEAHLSLSNHTYQLFKQFGDARSIGDRDLGKGEARLIGLIHEDIAAIRGLIAAEIRLVGDHEIEELERLAKIERQIDNLLVEHETLLRSRGNVSLNDYWSRLSGMLDVRIDGEFNGLIQAALDEEAREVREAREQAADDMMLTRQLAVLLALLAAVAAVSGLWLLLRGIREPIEELHRGARAIEAGNLEHRIAVSGPGELSAVARAFNRMADEVLARETALSSANSRLEQAVASRTAELERLLETVRENDRNRRRLLADVSHELRTPLTIIRGEMDVALRGGDKSPEVYREALQRARDAATHTSRLVDDLLFVARREAGELRLQRDAVDLAGTVQGAIEEFRGLAQQSGGEIHFSNGAGEARVHADEGRIRQVIGILLENALRYGGDRIEVRLERTATGFAIVVTDNGPGLPEVELAQAFDRYFRGTNAAQRYAHGVGLGLPVAKAIVEAHGGEIAMRNAAGEGLAVRFTVPGWPRLQAVS